MPARDAQQKDEKRERILAGAIRAFAARGFHRTRVSDVAKAAGVADGTIYLYFQGKDDLLRAVFEEAMDRFFQRGERVLAHADDPVEQLRAFVRLHLECVGEDRELAVVFQVDLRKSISFLQAVSRGRLQAYLEVLEGILQRGQEAGRFADDLPARELAKMVFGVLDELSTNWVLSEKNYRLETRVEPATTFLLRALRAGD